MNLSEAERIYREDETDPERFRVYFTELARQTTPTDVCLMVDSHIERYGWRSFSPDTMADITRSLIDLGIVPGVWFTAKRRKVVHHIPSGDIKHMIWRLYGAHAVFWNSRYLPDKVDGKAVADAFRYKSGWEENRRNLINK